MTFKELPAELQKELETKRFCIASRSSLVGDDSLVDAVLLSFGSKMDLNKIDAYTVEHVSVWFDMVAKPYAGDDEKCIELVKNALLA